MPKYLFLLVFLYGCSDKEEQDPCAEVDLPTCELAECPANYQDSHGEECTETDVDCTTGTGTGRVCSDEGTWVVLEPSHGEPGECNQECVFP